MTSRADLRALGGFRVVLVTGPQRSGTQIATQIIAAETGHEAVMEGKFCVHNRELFEALIRERSNVVVQCPGMCHIVHHVATNVELEPDWREKEGGPDIAVVLMRRQVSDILASQERIGWTAAHEAEELAKYSGYGPPIAVAKYHFWDVCQRWLVPYSMEVEYESLAGHPLWVPKSRRGGWTAHQTAEVD